jgi:hypothetical protein
VDAYSRIATTLSKAITDGYRRNKLSIYVSEANEPIKVLLDSYASTLESNLAMRLQTQEERLKSFYFDLSTDDDASLYEKKKVIEEYNNAIETLGQRKKLISSFARGLRSVAQGHEALYQQRNKLKNRQLRELLIGYYSNILDIADEFNKIKNTD